MPSYRLRLAGTKFIFERSAYFFIDNIFKIFYKIP